MAGDPGNPISVPLSVRAAAEHYERCRAAAARDGALRDDLAASYRNLTRVLRESNKSAVVDGFMYSVGPDGELWWNKWANKFVFRHRG